MTATNRQIGYCKWRAETIFWNDRNRLRAGKELDGWWYPPHSNGYATITERFTEHKKTLVWTRIVRVNGEDKMTMETEVYHFDNDKVDFSAAYHGELDGKEKETAERMF